MSEEMDESTYKLIIEKLNEFEQSFNERIKKLSEQHSEHIEQIDRMIEKVDRTIKDVHQFTEEISFVPDERRKKRIEEFDRLAESIRESRRRDTLSHEVEPIEIHGTRFPEYKLWMGRVRRDGNRLVPISYRQAIEGKYG